jgi:ABC-type branched-subunit amino acid transport system substrate-binding protein
VKRLILIAAIGVLLTGCAVRETESPATIALLAPFEGRYREIGYDALYAARLAMNDLAHDDLELLAVDDGGSVLSAKDRARALAIDPQYKAVVVLGYAASDESVQSAYGDLAVIVVGEWLTEPQSDSVFMFTSRNIREQLTQDDRIELTNAANVDAPFTGNEVFALDSFTNLRQNLSGIRVATSGQLPDEDFTRRILESDPFANEPGLLSTTAYDAIQMIANAIDGRNTTRNAITEKLNDDQPFSGINGDISFGDGYWEQAPIFIFIFDQNGDLSLLETLDAGAS